MDIAFKLECLRLADGNVRRAQEMAEWLEGCASLPSAGIQGATDQGTASADTGACLVELVSAERYLLARLLGEAIQRMPFSLDRAMAENILNAVAP